jgi:hypothetical protein
MLRGYRNKGEGIGVYREGIDSDIWLVGNQAHRRER